MAKKYYAVRKGRSTGVFETWAECKKNIDGFSGAVYKGFESREEAEAFVENKESSSAVSANEQIDIDAEATAYVDGSYNVHDKRFSYGAVIFYDGREHTMSAAFSDAELAGMRNVAGEIKGAEAAMRFCVENGIKSVAIYHDYEGIARWCLGDWKTNKEGTKAYKEYYDSIKDSLKVHFVKVKGHSGDKYNDLVDRLAKDALGIK